MSDANKIENETEDLKGAVKEHVGDATGNEDMADEGREDQAEAKAKKAGESMKDAARNAADALKKPFSH